MRRLVGAVAIVVALTAGGLSLSASPAAADIYSDNAGFTCAVTRNTNNYDHLIRHAHLAGGGIGWKYYLCESYKGSRVCNYGAYFFNPGYNGGQGGPFGPIEQRCH